MGTEVFCLFSFESPWIEGGVRKGSTYELVPVQHSACFIHGAAYAD